MTFTLCDINNSYYNFYQNGYMWHTRSLAQKDMKIKDLGQLFYISVNRRYEQKLLIKYPSALNIGDNLKINTAYHGLGVDRMSVCKAVHDGAIIDAGIAITVDIMEDGYHLGGYILPGLNALQNLWGELSSSLKHAVNSNVDISLLPQNTIDAISYGTIKSIVLTLKDSIRENKKVYFAGQDGKYFSRFFANGIYDETLIFKGMLIALCEYGLIKKH